MGAERLFLSAEALPREEKPLVPALRTTGPKHNLIDTSKSLRAGKESWTLLYLISNHPSKEGSSKDISNPMGMHLVSFKSAPRSFSRTPSFFI